MTSSADMTSPDVAAIPVPVDSCDACVHSLSSHDAIALRFCQATIATALSRSCVCSV